MSQVIRSARVRGADVPVDIAIDGDRIAAVAPSIEGSFDREYDVGGRLVAPGFVDIHLHLDKCMLGDVMRANVSGGMEEAVEITLEHKRRYTVDEIVERASPVVEAGILNGTSAMRGFADVGNAGGLVPVEALLALKRRFDGLIALEVAAFPQEGITRDPGAAELMEQAIDLGADVVGGLPRCEPLGRDVEKHIDFCLALGRRTGKDVHVLADNTDDSSSRSLEYLAARTIEEGYEGRVSATGCDALAAYDHAHAAKVIRLVAEAGITVVSNPQINLAVSGKSDRGLVRRGMTRVGELLAAGVNVVSAQDDVNDPYYPFGKPDQLEVAQYAAHVAHLTRPADLETVFDMVTVNPALAMRLERYGLEQDARADLVVIDAPSVRDALRLIPPRSHVFHGGKLVAETRTESTLHACVRTSRAVP